MLIFKSSLAHAAGFLLAAVGLAGCAGGEDQASAPVHVWNQQQAGQGTAPPALQSLGSWLPVAGQRDVGPPQAKAVARLLAPTPWVVTLPPMAADKALPFSGAMGQAVQIGAARDVPAAAHKSLPQQWHWQRSTEGGWQGAMSVRSSGAKGLRLGVLVDALPGSARLRVYRQSDPLDVFEISGHEVLQRVEANRAAGDDSPDGRTWWTPDVEGEEATLELELPAGVPFESVALAVPRVSHLFVDLTVDPLTADGSTAKIGESQSCQLDATCYTEAQDVSRAVARMIYVKSGSSYACTGTLLNEKNQSGTPYFISANHCVDTQTVASSLQTDWFYRAASCNARTLSGSATRRTGGATLLYANSAYDVSFMRLNDAPPAGVVYAGWNAGAQGSQTVLGVHHPAADLQKVSFGTLRGQTTCTAATAAGFSCTGSSGNFHVVQWVRGMTEGGSSGSGIFKGDQLLGVLRGGSSTCASLGVSVYGRFDLAFQSALHQWLSAEPASGGRAAVYRFYNARTGAHFYSGSAAERDFVISTLPEFKYENVAFYAYSEQLPGLSPVFRFYNAGTGAHFYSISVAERDFVRLRLPEFAYEGSTWYARDAAAADTVQVFRFYNAKTGAHFYTASAAERDFVISRLPEFQYESVAYHVWTSP